MAFYVALKSDRLELLKGEMPDCGESTAALDKVSGRNVVDMLKTMGHERGTTTVMVTHDNRILELADRVITLEEGRVVSDVRP